MDVLSIKGRAPYEIIESILQRGIQSFTPPQEESIKRGLLSSENIVVAAPTASGKTLIAEIACANSIIGRGKKAVYIAPMRALVYEKYNEFKAAYPYVKTAMSIGDLDSGDHGLQNCDMLFVSTEKFDSLLRHGISWLDRIGCLVFDEVHMLGESGRGPTLEVLMTKLKQTCSAQIVALSATIGNSDEIARWLKATLVQSDWRPVKLKKGVVHDGKLYYLDDRSALDVEEEELGGKSPIQEIRILQDTMERSKQLLVFYSTKRNAEAGAVKLSEPVEERLTAEEKMKLEKLGEDVLNVLDRPTEQCMKLSKLVRKGVAFHHAGLMNAQRTKIEEAFKGNLIKAICSTTTLGLGVNLPAHTVVVRDISRFDGGGSEMIGINEVLQLFGRAGRPKYDKEGRAMLIAPYKERVQELYRNYILAKPESVESNLGVIPVLRTHVLAFIAEGFLNSNDEILNFLKKTFYGFQYGAEEHLKNVIDEIANDLKRWGFIEEVGKKEYLATKTGKRVSELYIDPLSARWMLNVMEEEELDTVGILYMITNTLEMRPYARTTEEAEEMYASYRYIHKDKTIYNEFERMDYGYYDPVRAFSTAMMLKDWTDEQREQDIVKKYKSTPGEIYSKLSNADWMIYSAIELAKLVHKSAHGMINMRVRLRYGIKEELLDLVRLEQIGRVRARLLFMNGIKTVSDIRSNHAVVERALGKEVAKKVLDQLA
ncbi:MAG: DEAD/DEAH box helicase [Candidatus Micrarchaeales archaeon]|nr:DEAD/DEAH box helicase [Candidatus Micrarchaeales archaeon]